MRDTYILYNILKFIYIKLFFFFILFNMYILLFSQLFVVSFYEAHLVVDALVEDDDAVDLVFLLFDFVGLVVVVVEFFVLDLDETLAAAPDAVDAEFWGFVVVDVVVEVVAAVAACVLSPDDVEVV
jgi:hypothetical protein